MKRQLLTGNAAAAWGARLAGVDYVPAFPITPQTEIIETLSGWIDKGEMAARLTMLESEHSMLTAAGAASVTGVRVFTATSSQGLLYGMEMLYNVAGWRAPQASLGHSLLDARNDATRGTLCVRGNVIERIENNGWVAHDLTRRVSASPGAREGDLKVMETRLLAMYQVGHTLLLRNRIYPSDGRPAGNKADQ